MMNEQNKQQEATEMGRIITNERIAIQAIESKIFTNKRTDWDILILEAYKDILGWSNRPYRKARLSKDRLSEIESILFRAKFGYALLGKIFKYY